MAASNSEPREEIIEIREAVLEYKPGKTSSCPERVVFPENLYIGLFGQTGCGKTSLINSLKFAAHGRLRRAKWLAAATQEKAGGHTMFRRFCNITRNIFVIDNRGLELNELNTEKALTELRAQLDGKRGYGSKVVWQGDKDEDELDTSDLVLDQPQTGQPIGCAVFVFSVRHDIDSNTTGLTEVVDFLHGHQGRYPVAVITHVDVAEKDHVETLESVLRVCGFSDIFKVTNLTDGKANLEDLYQLSLLNLIERCMTDGDDTFIFKYYQKIEEKRREEIRKKQKEKARKEEDERRTRELEQRVREKERMAIEQERRVQEYRRKDGINHLYMEHDTKLQQQRYISQMEQEIERTERERDHRFKKSEAKIQKELERMRHLFL